MPSSCPVCRAPHTRSLHQVHDDRYGFVGEFQLFVCSACRHHFLDWQPSGETLTQLYTDYYPRSQRSLAEFRPLRQRGRMLGWWRGQRASASFWVPHRVRVLDIGCGFGESLAYHLDRGCEAYGVEVDQNIARVAARFGYDVRVGQFDASAYPPDFFDYVTMDQVLEHVRDPIATLRDIGGILREGGRLVLTTPNAAGINARFFGRRWINWHAPYHLHLFSKRSLTLAAQAAGLELIAVDTITSSEWINYQWIHVATAPARGVASPFWSGRGRTRRDRLSIGALRALHRLGIDHLFTRLFDSIGTGDNLVAQMGRAA